VEAEHIDALCVLAELEGHLCCGGMDFLQAAALNFIFFGGE
jgi:hypothetical protein